MWKDENFEDEEPTRLLYAFVESIVEADPENPRSRFSIQLDAIDAELLESAEGAIEENRAFMLARISTTPKRFYKLYDGGKIAEGDWLEIEVAKRKGMPRTWLLSLTSRYIHQEVLNIVSVRRMPEDWEQRSKILLKRIYDDAALEPIKDIEFPGLEAAIAHPKNLRITALDVGQAACVSFNRDGQCFGYFDVGAPLIFNKKSFPKKFEHKIAEHGFVILSHWDFDHYALALKYPALTKLLWYAPRQNVGPNTLRFQRSLGANLRFISTDLIHPSYHLARGSGATSDRNASGYFLALHIGEESILLTGDADYQWIPHIVSSKATSIMIPHHGGAGSVPPTSHHLGKGKAVASYGLPNTYKHPNEDHLDMHRVSGWRVHRTAEHLGRPRGDCNLYVG